MTKLKLIEFEKFPQDHRTIQGCSWDWHQCLLENSFSFHSPILAEKASENTKLTTVHFYNRWKIKSPKYSGLWLWMFTLTAMSRTKAKWGWKGPLKTRLPDLGNVRYILFGFFAICYLLGGVLGKILWSLSPGSLQSSWEDRCHLNNYMREG